LKTVREAAGKTQVAVAEESQINQGDISRLESRTDFDDCEIATLRRYLEALGGKLDLVAVFGDKRITIVGTETTTAKAMPANSALQRTGRKASRR
jgi:transcriptional regulator with XRE-family HTH domain